MKKNLTVTLLTATAAIVAVLGAYLLYGQLTQRAEADRLAQQKPAQEQTELTVAPDFTVYDKDGNAVKLSDFRGKPVVVNFFASWCGPCKMEMPYFEEFYQLYGDEVEFIERRDALTGKRKAEVELGTLFPCKHFVMPPERI